MVEKLREGGAVTFSPKGTSMLPMLRSGLDSVTLKKPPAKLKRGTVALFISSGSEERKYILHRLVRIKNGEYTFCGDNRLTADSPVPYENVLGVVTEFVRKGKKRSIRSFIYGLYSFYMVSTVGIRRFTLRLERSVYRIWKRIRGR